MAFDALPPELLMLILEVLDSTTDLYSVISASPAAWRLFKTASDRVLLNVVRRRIKPQTLRHAVATISVPSVNMNHTERSRFNSLWEFLDLYFSSGSQASENILLHAGMARALAMLHAHVCRHIRRYADQTCAQLSGPEHEQPLGQSRQHAVRGGQQLSSTELVRLERGFYRFELYCRVFPAEPGNALRTRSSGREHFQRFIKRLEPWEMEEIVCIHQYFVNYLGTIVDDIESQLVTSFLANACRELAAGDAQHLSYFDDLDRRDMTLFSTEFRKDSLHDLGYLAECGLAFMNDVLSASTTTERLNLIRRHGPGTRHLLGDALYLGAEELPHPPIARDFSRDDPLLPNLGYLKYAPDVTTIYMMIRESNFSWLPMRLLGYVFWDSDRLEDPLARSTMEQGQSMSLKELRQRFDRSKKPSAEARLQGFQVRREVMDDLVKDYASTLVLFPLVD